MICHPCRDTEHHDCRGGSWCDCQHEPSGVPWKTTDQRHHDAVTSLKTHLLVAAGVKSQADVLREMGVNLNGHD